MKPAHLLWIGAAVTLVVVDLWVVRGGKHAKDTEHLPFAPIEVRVNGEAHRPIVAAMLSRVAPDRTYEGWRLWKLRTLLDGEPAEGSMVGFERSDGKKAGLASPTAASGLDVALAVDGAGNSSLILARLASPSPMPPVLAKGRLSATVTKLEIRHAAEMPNQPAQVGVGPAHGGGGKGAPAAGAGGLGNGEPDRTQHEVGALRVSLADGKSASWSMEDVRRVPARNDIPTEQGAASAWSLRDVAATLVDSRARFGSLTNTKGETVTITAEEWNDSSRLPLLRINHRGLWKFDWVDASTRAPLGHGLRDVSGIALTQ